MLWLSSHAGARCSTRLPLLRRVRQKLVKQAAKRKRFFVCLRQRAPQTLTCGVSSHPPGSLWRGAHQQLYLLLVRSGSGEAVQPREDALGEAGPLSADSEQAAPVLARLAAEQLRADAA